MCGSSMVDIQSPTAEIRRGKTKKKEEEEATGQKYNVRIGYAGGHNREEKLKKQKKKIRSKETVRSRLGSVSVRVSVIALRNKNDGHIKAVCERSIIP